MNPPPILSSPRPEKTDREQLRLLAILHFVYSGLSVLGVLFLFLHFTIMNAMMHNPAFTKAAANGAFPPAEFMDMFSWFYLFMGAVFVALLFLNLISGFFLRRRRHRLFSLIVAGIDCVQIPFGTALGIFTFFVLLRESVQRLYDEHAQHPDSC